MALLPVGDQLRGLQSQGSSSVMWTKLMLMPQSRKKLQLIPEKGSIFDQNPEILPWYMPQISRHSQNWTFLDTVFSGPGEPIKNLVVSCKDRYKISRTKPVILSRINCGAQKPKIAKSLILHDDWFSPRDGSFHREEFYFRENFSHDTFLVDLSTWINIVIALL